MLPNFLLVGAAKCGTTSIFDYLTQHPEVFIPEKKECLFFSSLSEFRGIGYDVVLNGLITRSLAEYESLFSGVDAERALGDVSHDYLYYHDESIRNIKRYLHDDVRILIVLRDPRERAYSHYMHHVKGGFSPDRTFEEALARESERMRSGWSWNWHYTAAGLYHDQVKAYLDNFEHVRIHLYEDLVADAVGLMQDIYGFIGVDERFEPQIRIRNRGVSLRSHGLNRFLRDESRAKELARRALTLAGVSKETIRGLKKRAMTINAGQKSPMKDETRRALTRLFADDITRLEALIGRDLSRWKA